MRAARTRHAAAAAAPARLRFERNWRLAACIGLLELGGRVTDSPARARLAAGRCRPRSGLGRDRLRLVRIRHGRGAVALFSRRMHAGAGAVTAIERARVAVVGTDAAVELEGARG